MKSKLTIFIAGLFLSFSLFSVKAQTTVSKGKAQLIEFTNANAKFTVPAGKTWYINQVFSFYYGGIDVFIKGINGTELTNLELRKYGTNVYNDVNKSIQFPIIFPENTIFELIITRSQPGEPPTISDQIAYINFIETDN